MMAGPDRGEPSESLFDASSRTGVSPEALRIAESLIPEQIERIYSALDSGQRPYEGIDWQNLPAVENVAERLEIMARAKPVLPDNNMAVQKLMHNVTVENHIKLFLEAAGTKDNLEVFFHLVHERMRSDQEYASAMALEAFRIWAPAAEIAGWHGHKNKLEDTAFEIMFPEEKARIVEAYSALEGDKALHTAAERYSVAIEEGILTGLPELEGHFGIMGRRKSYFSVWRKCQLKGKPDYKLPDFIGLRVLIDSSIGEETAVHYCYAVRDEIHQQFNPDMGRYKDYIKKPRPNRYQSIHTTLREADGSQFEVQVRTTAMHEKVETDPNISHLTYEAVKLTPGTYVDPKKSHSMRMYRWREDAARLAQERRDGSISGLRPDEVLVFAKDGNLYHLPVGATTLDFAFKMQSDRALRTTGINKIESDSGAETDSPGPKSRPGLKKPVQYGDCFDPEYTSESSNKKLTWKEDWLRIATTGRARKRIDRARNEARTGQLVESARRKIEDHFRDTPAPLGLLSDQDKAHMCKKYGLHSFEMVLRQIGAGKAKPGKLIYRIESILKEKESKPGTNRLDINGH